MSTIRFGSQGQFTRVTGPQAETCRVVQDHIRRAAASHGQDNAKAIFFPPLEPELRVPEDDGASTVAIVAAGKDAVDVFDKVVENEAGQLTEAETNDPARVRDFLSDVILTLSRRVQVDVDAG